MIDISTENLVPLRDVPRLLPCRPNGKRVHVSAVYRWTMRGIRDCRLEVIQVGGTSYTSHEAIQRWADSLTRPRTERAEWRPPKSATRQRELDRVKRKLDEMLGIGKSLRSGARGTT